MINLKTIINRIRDIEDNQEYDAATRSYMKIGTAGIVVAYALAAYYLLSGGKNTYNGILILSTAVALSVFMVIGITTMRLKLGAVLSSAWATFILFPGTFFLGGGINSGAATWFLLGVVYISLILSGRTRRILFVIQLFLFSGCFVLDYFIPNLATQLSTFEMGVDSMVSVMVVGSVIVYMFFFRESITRKEQELATTQKEEIERLTESQQDFFSGMSRKIRTPIGGITGLNEIILRSENLNEDVEKNTRNIVSASNMLLTIIEDIIDMNKMQIGDIRIENSEYESASLFADVIGMLEPKAREKGLNFITDIAPDYPASLFGDHIRMKQILVNIINNAIKYTREGFVRFSVRMESENGTLIKTIYRVVDSGIGIKPENIDSLFSDFSRIDLGKNRGIEGTGLGLSIVKGILTAMGGDIKVESTYGKGSVFTVTIPQNRNGNETIGDINNYRGVAESKEKTRFIAKSGRILIVDDDRMSRDVVKKILSDTGATIDVCESGKDALRLTSEIAYHIIFMDHFMPEMDGIETFHRIRTQERGKNHSTPIVALTADAGENIGEVYQNIGFAGYLSKPVEINLLEEYVIKSMPGEIVEHKVNKEDEAKASLTELKKKVPVVITTDSTAGLNPEDNDRLEIATLPYCMTMPDGSSFIERTEIDIDSMRALQSSETIMEEVVNEEMAEAFFREQLKKADEVIHICILNGDISKNYQRLCDVADKVGHVTIFDSGTVSVGAGLMTVRAAKMASEGYQMMDILNALIELKEKIELRTRIGEINLMVHKGRFPKLIRNIFNALKIHPLIKTKESKLSLYGFMSEKSSMEDFIDMVLSENMQCEDEIYIAHSDVKNKQEEISGIVNYIKKHGVFNNIVVVQSSPIIVSNSGKNSLAVAMVRKDG